MQLKCMSPRLPDSGYKYKGYLIGYAPANELSREYQQCAGDKVKSRYSLDALVLLQEFSKGLIVQVPLYQVTIVEEWHEREE